MWFAAVAGRAAFLEHWICGHSVSWRRLAPDASHCPGDIICEDCHQVLWCRSHDPWRTTTPPDHWGDTLIGPTPALFHGLQAVLRLADACPAGETGDQLRRVACELIEAESAALRSSCRRRMLTCIAHAEWRHERGRSRPDDPSPRKLNELTIALGSVSPGGLRLQRSEPD